MDYSRSSMLATNRMAAAPLPAKASRPRCRLATKGALACLAPHELPRRVDVPPTVRASVCTRSSSALNELRSEPMQCHLVLVDVYPPCKAWASKHHFHSPSSAPGSRWCNPDPKAHPNELAFPRPKSFFLGHDASHPKCHKRPPRRHQVCRICIAGMTCLGGYVCSDEPRRIRSQAR